MMLSTYTLRDKYARRRGRTATSFGWTPAGSKDVLRLCDYADDLVEIVRWAQQQLSADRQHEIERKLWDARNKESK